MIFVNGTLFLKVWEETSSRIATVNQNFIIRQEQPEDIQAVAKVIKEAFANKTYSKQREHLIVDELRKTQKLFLSMVAVQEDKVVGYAAFSPVLINGYFNGWYGLGPIAVLPTFQHQGIGGALIRAGLIEMKYRKTRGVVFIDQLNYRNYYRLLGFRLLEHSFASKIRGVVLVAPFIQPITIGRVSYDKAFFIK